MNCYLMLRDPAPAANISMEPHLYEILRGDDGRFSVVVNEDADEIVPHAVYRCPNEETALALLAWIDKYGEEGVSKPEDYDARQREWLDANHGGFAFNPTPYPKDMARYDDACRRKPSDCLLLFRNGAPRGPKGGCEVKHTPGPWNAVRSATCGHLRAAHNHRKDPREEWTDADIALLNAAPGLLAALEVFTDFPADTFEGDHDGFFTMTVQLRDLRAARAAIAKAKGGAA